MAHRLFGDLGRYIVILAALLALCACAGGGDGVTPPSTAPPDPSMSVGQPGGPLPEGFTLSVDPATYLDGACAARVVGSATGETDLVDIDVRVEQARGLKALYFALTYDPAAWHPVAANASGLLADAQAVSNGASGATRDGSGADGGLLELAVMDQPGVVHHGQVLAHPEARRGFTGDGVLARVRFARGPATGTRRVSSPPHGANSAPELYWDGSASVLGWEYVNDGDYDQDGVVSITDMTPLARFINETANGLDATRPQPAVCQVDGDHNSLVSINDITPIGANFGHSVLGGFRVYSAEGQAAYPTDPEGPNGAGAELLGTRSLAEASLGAPDHRLWFTFPATPQSKDSVYWVRAVDENGNEGTVSNVCKATSMRLPDYSAYSYSQDPLAAHYEETKGCFQWYYDNPGDYNQDGVVASGDCYTLAEHWHQSGPFNPYSVESIIDYNNDDEINIFDVETIASEINNTITHYDFYVSSNIFDYPFNYSLSTIEPIAIIPLYMAQGDPITDQLYFQVAQPSPAPGTIFWVRATIAGLWEEGVPIASAIPFPKRPPYDDASAPLLAFIEGDVNHMRVVHYCVLDLDYSGHVTFDGVEFFGNNLMYYIASDQYVELYDLNRDGVNDNNDLIAAYNRLGITVEKYNIYLSENVSEYPETNEEISTIEPFTTVALDRPWTYGDGEYYQVFEIPAEHASLYFWARPVCGGVEGTPSAILHEGS